MSPLAEPGPGAVRALTQQLHDWSRGDDRYCRFLRGYFATAAARIAANILLVRRWLDGRPLRVLDVGSFGVELLVLAADAPGLQAAAVSYEGDRVCLRPSGFAPADGDVPADARSVLTVARADVELEPLPFAAGAFDLVLCCELLEHLKSTPLPLLRELRRVLAADGHLLLTTPNAVGTRSLGRLLLGKNTAENPRYHRDPRYGIVHPKEYTPGELRALLAGQGFTVEAQATRYHRPVGWGERLLGVGLAGARLAARRRGPWGAGLGDTSVVVARRSAQEPDAALPAFLFEPG